MYNISKKTNTYENGFLRMEQIMKKKISICLFIGILALINISCMILWMKQKSDHTNWEEYVQETECRELETESEILSQESMHVLENSKFYLGEKDGYLVVFLTGSKEVYCETNIRVEFLTEEFKEKLAQGISFQTEEELYEFLENYSS